MEVHNCPFEERDILNVKSIYRNEESISRMQEDIHKLGEDVRIIKTALLGDNYNPGFKQRIEFVELETDKIKKNQDTIKSYIMAIVSILGLIGVVIGILTKTGLI